MLHLTHETPPTEYVATRTLSLPAYGVAYLADARIGGRAHRWHRHDEIQVIWVRAGRVGVQFEPDRGVDEPAAEMGAWVVPAGVSHVVVAPLAWGSKASVAQLIDLRIIDDPSNPLRQYVMSLGPARHVPTAAPAVERAARRLETTADTAGPARLAAVMSAVWELLATLRPVAVAQSGLSRIDDAAGTNFRDPRVDAAEEFCRHQLSAPISVGAIAAAVGLSRSQLSRLFLSTYGMGPAQRLRQLRVELARRLLAETTLSVKEIAHACGFVRPNHFGRVFQNETGTTASAFRAGRATTDLNRAAHRGSSS
jgi:AraC-like DNA-binding protein